MKRNLIIILTVVFLIWLLPATAKSYRWVDENGVTIYSQSPPPSGDATVIKPPPPPATPPEEAMKKLKEQQAAIDKSRSKKNEADKKDGKEAKNAEIKKQTCEASKKNLEQLELHPRVRMKMDDGSYKQLTDEERTAEIQEAKKGIEKYCNK